MPDPGTGLEHLGEDQAGARKEEEEAEADQPPHHVARHFAMRNLMNAAGVLDGLKQVGARKCGWAGGGLWSLLARRLSQLAQLMNTAAALDELQQTSLAVA